MTNSRAISLWLSEEEISEIKSKSAKEKRSLNNWVKCKLFADKKK